MFSIEEIKKDPIIKGVTKDIAEYRETASAMVITTPELEGHAIEMLKPLKDFAKKVEEKRKFFVGPANEFVKQINGIFQPRIKELNEIEAIIKGKMRDYRVKVEDAARKERERVERENARKNAAYQEKLRKEMEAAAEAGRNAKFIKAPAYTPPAEIRKSTATETAQASYRTVKKWKVGKAEAIPLQYYKLDEVKINTAVKAGIEIPGIIVYEDKEIAIR